MTKKTSKHHDVIIIGAGPAGLSFARALAETNLSILLIEKLPEKILENPPVDGRDIALTHLSEELMKDLGIWENMPGEEIGKIKEAKVLSGDSPYSLHFDHHDTGKDTLGYIVSNHIIRKAVYDAVKEFSNIEIVTETEVTSLETDERDARVTLSDGKILSAPLVVAADSRFSNTRRKMGISASMLDFGRVCIVCRMTHEGDHHNVAYECFHDDRTLAVLPLSEKTSSIVITLSAEEADSVMTMEDAAFNTDIQNRFESRLGRMKLTGEKHAYPLVAVYARHFAATRFALIGDAAVGMHPVTAHGFNLGLRGAVTLAEEVKSALALGGDIGALNVLKKYETKHNRAAKPLYLGTNALVRLYTKNTVPAKILRRAMLRLGNNLPPVKRLIMNQLTEIQKLSA